MKTEGKWFGRAINAAMAVIVAGVPIAGAVSLGQFSSERQSREVVTRVLEQYRLTPEQAAWCRWYHERLRDPIEENGADENEESGDEEPLQEAMYRLTPYDLAVARCRQTGVGQAI